MFGDDLGLLDGIFEAAQQLVFFSRYYGRLWIPLILVSIAAAIYIFVDSNRRNIKNAVFWRVAAVVNVALFIPTIIVAFDFMSAVLGGNWDILALFAYMGIASSIIALGLSIGYWINFRELARFEPEPEYGENVYTPPPPTPQPMRQPAPAPQQPRAPYKSPKPKANAWLVMKSNNKNYQLNRGTTFIGRSSKTDIPILNDATVSSQHIKITEENGHYKMVDLGSTNGTWVNGYRVRQPILLDINDEIRLGDNTYMKFVAS